MTNSLKQDPMIFSLYSNLGIFLANFPLLLITLVTQTFKFYPMAFVGSCDILVINFFAFQAVQLLGYSTAPAVWCSIGMISAFLQGLLLFRENSSHPLMGFLAIPLLIAGVVTVIFSQSTQATNDVEKRKPNNMSAFSDLEYENLPLSFEEDGQNKSIAKTERISSSALRNQLTAFLFCGFTGFFDGSLMTPLKLSHIDTSSDLFSYIACFGLGSILVSPIFFLLYYSYVHFLCPISTKQEIHLQLQMALIPGTLTGMLWAAANLLGTIATAKLGMKIGFPLTQTCVVFTALWGVFYFKEIVFTDFKRLFRLAFGIFAVIIGSVLLAQSG
jgi:glucose uptake protein GlcU